MSNQSNSQAGRVYSLAELTAAQIRSLDRTKTVVLIPGGILEEHGPYLPCFTDGYINEHLSREIAIGIASRPGWTVLVFPTIPLGTGGANEIGEKYSFPGTYTVRTPTLRAVFMDVATELGEQGFRWIFVMHLHGGPNHNKALAQACGYFDDTYGGRMLNLAGLVDFFAMFDAGDMTEEDRKGAQLDIHAGTMETSWMLFLQPRLVNPAYKEAVSYRPGSWSDLIRIATAPDWPGHFSSPAASRASYGRVSIEKIVAALKAAVFRVLDGEDLGSASAPAQLPQESTPNNAVNGIAAQALDEEDRRQGKQNEWLKKRGLR